MSSFTIHNGNCIDVMRTMPDCSVDAIVTDPPYELGFMGKSWDNTGIAFNVEVWQEALRVLKPGGHLLAFSGSRTYHRMAVAIEDAGFQIRDQIMWLYGSGFPKSLDVSKAIDKAAGSKRAVIDEVKIRKDDGTNYALGHSGNLTSLEPITPEAQQWAGWGTALKPAHEPIVLARKPLIGTVVANVLEFGTGGLNIDGSRVAHASADDLQKHASGVQTIKERGGVMADSWKNSSDLSGANDVSVAGRFPANIIHDGSDEVLAGFPSNVKGQVGMKKDVGDFRFITGDTETVQKFDYGTTDTGSAARFFYCAKASKRDRNEGLEGFEGQSIGAKGNGLARICATCGASTIQGCECPDRTYVNPTRQNHHPTVKPTDLMRYLVKLITPPGGIVLDPFTGSGSTGKGAVIEGFNFIGIELDPDYVAIANARIQHQLDKQEGQLA